jgi:hypothetical protein
VTAAQTARALAQTAGNRELAQKNETLIELYRAEKPYRENTP